jgi:death on curing protein
MISVREVEHIHAVLIEKFGGSKGIRDHSLLESAINRPFQTFDLKDLYPTNLEKAAALFQSLIVNHPFIDGNKRTAYVLLRLYLMSQKLDIQATQEEKYVFVIKAAEGRFNFDQNKNWIIDHSVDLSDI